MDIGEVKKVTESSFLPRKKCLDWQEISDYWQTKIRRVPSKFAVRAVVVELDDSFQTFLPNRVNVAVDKDEALFNKLKNAIDNETLVIKYQRRGFFRFSD